MKLVYTNGYVELYVTGANKLNDHKLCMLKESKAICEISAAQIGERGGSILNNYLNKNKKVYNVIRANDINSEFDVLPIELRYWQYSFQLYNISFTHSSIINHFPIESLQ